MTGGPDPSTKPRRRVVRRLTVGLAAILVASAIGWGGVYGIDALQRNPPGDATCRPALDLAQKIAPLTTGEVAAVSVAKAPLRIPELAFEDGEGKPRKLSEWRGRTVLVNLWATWCVPCRKEMPALDNLQAALGSDQFEVLAINIDTRDAEKPKAFLKDAGLTRLGYYADAKAKVFQDLKSAGKALGMPTTLLLDEQGCEIASIAGPAQWDSPEAIALLKKALTRSP
ncbi:TlpA family protein disulfide reductase [Rhodopseudomonas pseudopalustris]|uniref:thiol:disulfide interchange protein TlpA n=1 Tax=Rhodopseudomonas pseudopalustris TaxID=1513892 RepID=UPI003F95FFAA